MHLGSDNDTGFQREQLAILEEQLAVACRRAQRYREALLRIAGRIDSYSYADVWAAVADGLEVSVVEMEAMLEEKHA